MVINSHDIEHEINICYSSIAHDTNKTNHEVTKQQVVLEFEALMLKHIKELFDKTIPYDDSNFADMKREGFVKAMKKYISIEKDF